MCAAKLLPRHHEQFRSKEYWDDFFEQRTEAFEWYGEYNDLRRLVHRTLKPTDRILVVGCGNSNFSVELYDDGFEEVDNVDFSQPVVAEMCRAHSKVRPRMTWKVMDVTDMAGYEDNSFDVVVDKGTLDALMSENTPQVRESGMSMLKEVQRVLCHGGRYMCITLWQDFIGAAFLSSIGQHQWREADASKEKSDGPLDDINDGTNRSSMGRWTIDLHTVAAASKPSPYLPLCVVATKLSTSVDDATLTTSSPEGPNGHQAGAAPGGTIVAAWCDSGGKPLLPGKPSIRLVGESEVLTHVREAQQLHRRRHDLREIRPGRFEQEDIWGGDASRGSPRFSLLILDVGDYRPDASPCAVVLIPRGRDREFTFSCAEGLEQVAQSANTRRLIAIRLNRGHDFSAGVEGVKSEISPVVPDFAPEASGTDLGGIGIPIMAVSDGLGMEGRVVAEGCLECSGNYVVEEEEEEEDGDDGRPPGVYRRLVFLKNEGVVQTEVRLLGEDEEDLTSMSLSSSSTAASQRSNRSKGGGKKGGKGKGKAKKNTKPGTAKSPSGCDRAVNGPRVDLSHLCFGHHRCMVAGVALADLRPTHNNSSAGGVGRAPTALVVGLGGGALPMALRRMYPSLRVLTVELDPEMATIAQEHFGLVQSDHLKVLVEDGIAFVNYTAAAATPLRASSMLSGAPMQNDSNRVSASNTTATFAAPALPETTADKFQTTDAVDSENSPLPPVPVDSSGAQPSARPSGVAGATEHSGNAGVPFAAAAAVAAVDAGWGGVFGPPYSAIFVDVDNKDASVGMSSPPAAFLEKSFLDNLKALLQGAGLASVGAGGLGGGGGGEGPPGVLAMNVAARSKQLFSGAVDAVCQAFPGGEVHKLRAGDDDVNSILLALPRPRSRARSGPLSVVAEQVLASAAVPRRAVANILQVCERAERLQLASTVGPVSVASGSGGKQASKSSGKKRGGR